MKNVKEKKKLLKNKYSEIFKYKGNILCVICCKEKLIEVKELKYDIFEELDYDAEEVLCECRRLMHCKPLSHFIKYKNGECIIVTNCCYCRIFKA